MMKKKLLSLALALAMCMSLCVTAFAFEDCDSDIVEVTVDNTRYKIWSTLFKDGSKYRAATWIQTANNSNIPAQGVKVQSFLMGSDGEIKKSSLSALSSPSYFHVTYTPYTSTSQTGIFAKGTAYIRTGSGNYLAYDSNYAQERNLSRSQAIQEGKLTADGNFPQNINGETYGSLSLASAVGTEPDLISAIGVAWSGTSSQSGYVRRDELFADYGEDTEAFGGRYITLYDVNGKDIGSFKIHYNHSSEVAGMDIDAVRAKLADGRAENPALWDLADRTLVNGKYPVNKNGETYGPDLSELMGYWPELHTTVNEDNVHGYTRLTDEPIPVPGAKDDSGLIPLYDRDGVIIGGYRVGGVMPIKTAGKTIAQIAREIGMMK